MGLTDKFCLLDNAEVLTSSGWINITNITMNHKIATLDGNNIKYDNPIDVYKFSYNGDMVKIRSQYVDLNVTIDHELYVTTNNNKEYELIPAKDIINKTVRYKKNCNNTIKDINDKDDYIKQYGKDITNNKSISTELLRLGERQSRLLLDTIMDNRTSLCITSKQLSDDIMTLSIHSGWSSTITMKGNKYTITINKDNNNPKVFEESNEVYNHNGYVYCLEVPSHVFMIRVNGKNVWIGNCSRHGYILSHVY
jgi:hypothetical protein